MKKIEYDVLNLTFIQAKKPHVENKRRWAIGGLTRSASKEIGGASIAASGNYKWD